MRQSKSVYMYSCARISEESFIISSALLSSSSAVETLCTPREKEPSGSFRMQGNPSAAMVFSTQLRSPTRSTRVLGVGTLCFSSSSAR